MSRADARAISERYSSHLDSTLQTYITSVLATSEAVAIDHTTLADGLDKISAQIDQGEKRGEDMRKKVRQTTCQTVRMSRELNAASPSTA